MAKPTPSQPQPMPQQLPVTDSLLRQTLAHYGEQILPTASAKFRDNDSPNDKNNKDKKRDGQS
jgi:hypothetical protein